jgi:hypothetical protein
VTRRRSSAPGLRSARRLFLLAFLAAAVAAACGPSGPTASPAASDALPSDAPATFEPAPASDAPSDLPEPTDEFEPSDDPEPTDDPGPTDEPATGTVDACTGTDENRDFYEAVASAVGWPVYCPSLPRGWNVESGQYRLANGGRMEISYRGPDAAGLRLQEGAFCEGDGCVPSGSEIGAAAFGDREGTLYEVDGGWAIAVDPGEAISWLIVVTGVGETQAREFAADLVRLDD